MNEYPILNSQFEMLHISTFSAMHITRFQGKQQITKGTKQYLEAKSKSHERWKHKSHNIHVLHLLFGNLRWTLRLLTSIVPGEVASSYSFLRPVCVGATPLHIYYYTNNTNCFQLGVYIGTHYICGFTCTRIVQVGQHFNITDIIYGF